MKKYSLFLFSFLLMLALFACSNPSSPPVEEPAEEEPTIIEAPDNLMGTIALENGKSAVFEIQFDSAAPSPSSLLRAATTGVSGKVRYDGVDYIIGGLYNFETGAMNFFAANAADEQFVFIGTYTPGSGFTGTVRLLASDGTTVITEGSASAAAIDDADISTTIIYTGTYGGESYGTWNGTLTNDTFYGTYSGIDASGSFSTARSGNSLSFSGNPGGTGTVNGSNVYGTWTYTTINEYGTFVSRGSWSGAAVDTSTLDPDAPDNADDKNYLNSLILQAWENGRAKYDMALNSGSINFGDNLSGITLAVSNWEDTTPADNVDDNDDFNMIYTFNNYNDAQTGLTLSGAVLLRIESDEITEIYVDSDTSNYNTTSPTDNGGMTITFSDSSTCSYIVMVSIDNINSSFAQIGSTAATWTIDGTSVLTSAVNFYF